MKRTYGSTEAPTVTTSGPDDSVERARDTDGRALGDVELEVHDPETAARLGPGAVGELWLRGPELFAGYVDPDATAGCSSDRGRWFRTGDLGVLDEEGWLQVVGRLSDIIIRAGENISASEVEAVLEAHPDVRHAVAVAVARPGGGRAGGRLRGGDRTLRPGRLPGLVRGPGRDPVQDPGDGGPARRPPRPRRRQARPHHDAGHGSRAPRDA